MSWVEWNGGACPVGEGQMVNIRFRHEKRDDGIWPGDYIPYLASEVPWLWNGTSREDVTAYRLAS